MNCCLSLGKGHLWQFSAFGIPEDESSLRETYYARHCSTCGCVEEVAWKNKKAYWEVILDCEEEV